MTLLSIIQFLLFFGLSIGKSLDLNIYGGRPSEEGEFPFYALLYIDTPLLFTMSGGVIVQFDKVLTTGHTWIHPKIRISTSRAVAGGTMLYAATLQKRNVSHVMLHSRFKQLGDGQFKDDLAVIGLIRPFEESIHVTTTNIKPVDKFAQDWKDISNLKTPCRFIGFGKRGDEAGQDISRQQMVIEVIPTACPEGIGSKTIVCARPTDEIQGSCQSDEGGPLVCNQSTYAVLSTYDQCSNSTMMFTLLLSYINYFHLMSRAHIEMDINQGLLTIFVFYHLKHIILK